MATEVTVHPPYSCPACGERLKASDPRWAGWLLCPRCGSPGQPPVSIRVAALASASSTAHSAGSNGAATPERPAGSAPDSPLPLPRPTGLPSRPRPGRPARAMSTARWIGSSGLAVSGFLLLVSYLDRKPLSMAVFGSLSAVFALVLILVQLRSRRVAASGGGKG